jgi:hypothetical protein
MARLHGNKRYYQILLDEDKAQRIEDHAARGGVRVTALLREWIYEKLTSLTHARTP